MEIKQMQPTKVKVGNYNYYITPFPALTAANYTGELGNVLAPLFVALLPLIADGEKEKGLGDIDAYDAARAMSNVSFSGDNLERLITKFLTTGCVVVEIIEDGKDNSQRLDKDLVNELFCGDVIGLFALTFHVIKTNFAGFFEKNAAQFGKVTDLAAKVRTII